jgi:hypothetical protein
MLIRFEPEAGPWANTLLAIDVRAPVRVPPGVGVIPRTGGLRLPPKSGWILLGESPVGWEGVRLRRVKATPAGILYRNVGTVGPRARGAAL